jgi:hypothetical protein
MKEHKLFAIVVYNYICIKYTMHKHKYEPLCKIKTHLKGRMKARNEYVQKPFKEVRHQWLTSVILASWEAEIGRTTV